MVIHVVISGEYAICNCTPHEVRFQESDGGIVIVQPSGLTLAARPVEVKLDIPPYSGIEAVRTSFIQSDEGKRELGLISQSEQECNIVIIPVGSIISAQAWPGRVVSLVPVPGFERKPPAEKLYHVDKFNVF